MEIVDPFADADAFAAGAAGRGRGRRALSCDSACDIYIFMNTW